MAAVLTVVAGFVAARLKIDGDLRVLLPPDHPVVQSLEQIESTFGSTNSVNIVAKGGTAEQRHAFTDALEQRLQGHPLFRDVEHGLPSRWFAERGLYYLTDAELEQLEERIDVWTHYQLCTAAPDTCLTEPDPEARAKLRAFIEDKRERSWERTGFRDRYEREGIDAEVMLVHPYEAANRITVAVEVTKEIRAIATEIYEQPGAWSGGDMTYNILGPYVTKADENDTIKRDMVRSGLFAFVGVVAILYFLFRSNRAVLVLLVPLMCGVTWSLAATQLVLGHLNVMTSTISTVVMGMGIDAGIHFFSRAKRARLEYDDGEAIVQAFDGLVIPLLVASSTTIGAFVSMASSEFPAFREFGIISALGVALCLLSMVTVLPALCYLVGIKKREPGEGSDEPGVATKLVLARPGLLFVALVVLSVVAVQGVRHVQFEYNGRKLQSDAARERGEPDAKLISKIFGKDIHASVLVRPDYESSRQTLELARKRHEARVAQGDTVVAELFGVSDLLPDSGLDMQARAKRIAKLEAEHRELLDELRERAGLEPLPPEQQPEDDGAAWEDVDDDDDWGAGTPTGGGAKAPSEGGDGAEGGAKAPSEGGDDEDWGDDDDAQGDAAQGDAAKDVPAKDDAAKTPAAKDETAIGDDWDEDGSAEDWGSPGQGKADAAAKGDEGDEVDKTDAATETDAAKTEAGAEPKTDAAKTEAGAEPKTDAAKTDAGATSKTNAKPTATDDEDELSKDDAELLLAMFAAKPFGVDDLPPVLLDKVRSSDGSYALFAYPAFDVADMRLGMVFMDETSGYLEDPSSGIFVGEAVVYAAMFLMLREEAPVVLGMAALLIAVLVFWQLRSFTLTLLTLVPLGLAMWWLLALMGTIDLRFTLFNLPILPAILGIGVDNGVYLTDRIRRSPATRSGLAEAVEETGGAILAATATTAVGFAAFMVADSGGVRGIGGLAVLGILLAAGAALLVLPTATALMQRRRW